MGSRHCTACDHLFFAHGPGGCTCGCNAVLGGLVRGDSLSAAEDMIAILRRGLDDRSAAIMDDGESGA